MASNIEIVRLTLLFSNLKIDNYIGFKSNYNSRGFKPLNYLAKQINKWETYFSSLMETDAIKKTKDRDFKKIMKH
jgi:hypothetical protein